jgi:hypothetical protein
MDGNRERLSLYGNLTIEIPLTAVSSLEMPLQRRVLPGARPVEGAVRRDGKREVDPNPIAVLAD